MSSTNDTTNTASTQVELINLDRFKEAINDHSNPSYAKIQKLAVELLADCYSPIQVMKACNDFRTGLFFLARNSPMPENELENSLQVLNQIDYLLGSGIVQHEAAMFRMIKSLNPDMVFPEVQ